MRKFSIILCLITAFTFSICAQGKISIPSRDKLPITAEMYDINDTLPTIILCHQAGYSRGEYKEIAPKLNKLGFNCLAVDLRSGGTVNGVTNETAAKAKSQGKSTKYLDAEKDILSVIDFISFSSEEPIILWGSSYSASLALKIATQHKEVDAVLSFSPGEYLKGVNLANEIKLLNKPVFITSSKSEFANVLTLTKDIRSQQKTQFVPEGKGDHGSKVLWNSSPDYLDYWTAVILFLKNFSG